MTHRLSFPERMKRAGTLGWRLATMGLALILLGGAASCASSTAQTSPKAPGTSRIIVTRDFGAEVLLEAEVSLADAASALDALKAAWKVETAYGGGFVNAIGDLRSTFGRGGSPQDWFFYVNGIQANTGAADYRLTDGDVQSWDFHSWGAWQFLPAMVGLFPEPFLHGYGGVVRPTALVFGEGFAAEAEAIRQALIYLGVAQVDVVAQGELTAAQKERNHLIIVDTADAVLIRELNAVSRRLGLMAYFQDGVMRVASASGGIAAEYRAAGVIQATQSPWNSRGVGACENVVWMVSGTDAASVRAAANVLIHEPSRLRYAFAVVVADGEVIRVPL